MPSNGQRQPTASVTDRLRDEILAGVFAPGERLLEIPLSERYGCGRATVRSALVELGSEGLVAREANRGATVRRLSIDEAVQLTEARSALEELAAAKAAERASEQDGAELGAIVADMRRAVADERNADYAALNHLLHRRIHEISGHTVAADLITTLRNRAAHHQFRLSTMPGRSAVSLGQHAAIVDAIVAGDAAAAGEAMAAHLGSVIDVLRRWEELSVPS